MIEDNHLARLGFIEVKPVDWQFQFEREDGSYLETLKLDPFYNFELTAKYNGGEIEYPKIPIELAYAILETKRRNHKIGLSYEEDLFLNQDLYPF